MIRSPHSKEIRKDFYIHSQFPIPNSQFPIPNSPFIGED